MIGVARVDVSKLLHPSAPVNAQIVELIVYFADVGLKPARFVVCSATLFPENLTGLQYRLCSENAQLFYT